MQPGAHKLAVRVRFANTSFYSQTWLLTKSCANKFELQTVSVAKTFKKRSKEESVFVEFLKFAIFSAS